MKVDQGCERERPMAMFDIPGYGELKRCPVAALTPESLAAMKLYPHWKHGRLPVITELPAELVDAMEVIGATVNLCEIEAMEARR